MMSILFLFNIFIFFFILSSLCESGLFGVKIRKNIAFIVKNHLLVLFILVVFIYYLINLNIIDTQAYAMSDEASGTIIDQAKNVNTSTTVTKTPSSKSSVNEVVYNYFNINLMNNSLLIINSPLEEEELTSQTLSSILNSILTMNICNLTLLIVMLTTFLQYLVVINSLNIDYLDKLPLGQSIKKIVLKWKKFTSRSLLVYLFIWWLLLFISNFFSINYLQFIVTNFDSIIELILLNK